MIGYIVYAKALCTVKKPSCLQRTLLWRSLLGYQKHHNHPSKMVFLSLNYLQQVSWNGCKYYRYILSQDEDYQSDSSIYTLGVTLDFHHFFKRRPNFTFKVSEYAGLYCAGPWIWAFKHVQCKKPNTTLTPSLKKSDL